MHLLTFHRVLDVELVLSQTTQLYHRFELLHVFFERDLRSVKQNSGQDWHFDLVKPVESPLDCGIGEDVAQCLRDLTLNVDRLKLVYEVSHSLGRKRCIHGYLATSHDLLL